AQDQRRSLRLGQQRPGPGRRWHAPPAPDARIRGRRLRRRRRGRQAHGRIERRRLRLVVGRQYARPAGRRHDDQPPGHGTGRDGTNTNRLVPTFIASGFKFVSVASGFSTFGITTSGDLYAWGWNGDGELGDGTRTDRSTPTFIGSGFSKVAVGYTHTVAIKSGG